MKRALAVVPKEPSLPAERSTGSPTVEVREAMLNLIADCARQTGEVDEDRKRVLSTWHCETAEFDPEICAEVFRGLLRDNPRNPFRPTVNDIVARCEEVRREWSDRIRTRYSASSGEELPRWCAQLTVGVLRGCLQSWSEEAERELQRFQELHSATEHVRPHLLPSQFNQYPADFTDQDRMGWFMVGKIGASLAEWPPDLLGEFDVPTGSALARLRALVAAEQERREREKREERERLEALDREWQRVEKLRTEAREAAMARPEVEAADAAWKMARNCGGYTQTLRAFQDAYRPAHNEELVARGLPPEHHL